MSISKLYFANTLKNFENVYEVWTDYKYSKIENGVKMIYCETYKPSYCGAYHPEHTLFTTKEQAELHIQKLNY